MKNLSKSVAKTILRVRTRYASVSVEVNRYSSYSTHSTSRWHGLSSPSPPAAAIPRQASLFLR
jgi:hypothetical protein